MNKPIYPHDCDDCIPLGAFNNQDLYYCDQLGMPTVISRFGIDGNYTSGLCFSYGQSKQLTEARERYELALDVANTLQE